MTASIAETAAAHGYRYRITLYDRITVDGAARLTYYHVYEPINPTTGQSNVFVPVDRESSAGSWADAQDCYGNKIAPTLNAFDEPMPANADEALAVNPFDTRYGPVHPVLGPSIEIYDTRTGGTVETVYYDPETKDDYIEANMETLERANTLWMVELHQQPMVCGRRTSSGNAPQPPFPDDMPEPPVIRNARIVLPDGAWAYLNAAGELFGVQPAGSRVIWAWKGSATGLQCWLAEERARLSA